jgi:tetratricopeptide (TPR) repeat protein
VTSGTEALPGAYHAAVADLQAGRLDAAEDGIRRLLRAAPRDAQALHLLGIIAAQRGRHGEARARLEEAISIDSLQPAFHCNLGNVLAEQGRPADAIAAYDAAIRLEPRYAEAYFNRANALQARGRLEDAARDYRQALALSPDHPGALCNLGVTLSSQGDLARADEAFGQVLARNPDHPEALIGRGEILRAQGKPAEAVVCFRRALDRRPNLARGWKCLARSLHVLGRMDEAMACYRRAIRLGGDRVEEAYSGLVRVLYMQGKFTEARTVLQQFGARFPGSVRVAQLKTINADHALTPAELESLETALAEGTIDEREEIADLHFSLGAHFDRAGEYDRAFRHFVQGNAIRVEEYSYDPDRFDAAIDEICSVVDRSLLGSLAPFGSASERPVFVVGMLRSGTTLTEQILASHPDVAAGGELMEAGALASALPLLVRAKGPYWRCLARLTPDTSRHLAHRYLAVLDRISPDSPRVTDKNPGNYFLLGLLSALFPNAKIVHCRRDPRDTCLSIFFHNFEYEHRYAYDLYAIGRRYRAYQRLMEHWRSVLPSPILDLAYEDVVSDLESASRRLTAFCGLSWDERVLQFHRTHRTVKTASLWQVRQPIYHTSMERWRAYEKYLAPLEHGLRGEPRQNAGAASR